MAKFCGKCGTKIDEATGFCPNCDAKQINNLVNYESKKNEKISNSSAVEVSKKDIRKKKKVEKRELKKLKKKAKRENWSLGKKIRRFFLKIIFVILLFSVLAGGVIGTFVYLDIIDVPIVEVLLDKVGIRPQKYHDSNNDGDINFENYKVDPPDAYEYFQKNSQIKEEINANESRNVLTEAEVFDLLNQRGFSDLPITTEYDINGNYCEATEISDSSSVKHPIYDTYFVTETNEWWSISVIDRDIMAIPLSYNLQSTAKSQLVISESETVTSYDSATNKFYKNVPYESVMIIMTVEKIDAETLEKLTIEEIDQL